MTPLFTPPRRRNAQVRTYWRLLQYALKNREIPDTPAARDVYKKLQDANARLTKNARDRLTGIDASQLVESAHKLLGLSPNSLLKPGG